MDDWISFVYGSKRTFKSQSIEILHHTGAHQTRYDVDESHSKLVPKLVKDGKQKIVNYMREHSISEDIISKFQNDRFSGAPYKDLPKKITQK